MMATDAHCESRRILQDPCPVMNGLYSHTIRTRAIRGPHLSSLGSGCSAQPVPLCEAVSTSLDTKREDVEMGASKDQASMHICRSINIGAEISVFVLRGSQRRDGFWVVRAIGVLVVMCCAFQ